MAAIDLDLGRYSWVGLSRGVKIGVNRHDFLSADYVIFSFLRATTNGRCDWMIPIKRIHSF